MLAWDRALKYIPGGSQTLSKCPDRYVNRVYPKLLSHGEGCRVWDEDGKPYTDYICGLGPIILGYNNKYVNNAVKTSIENGKVLLSLPHSLEGEVAELLNKHIPSAEKIRFFKTGTEALMSAVRLARGYTKKTDILVCGYHGWADWYAISTDKTFGVPEILVRYTKKFEYNNLQDVEDKLKSGSVAAIVLEPVIYDEPQEGFLEGLKQLSEQYGCLLVFDEVITGFRFGLGGAQSYFKVTPDISCFSKALGNGFPVAAIVGKAEYMDYFQYPTALMSGTFGGDLVGLSAAKATIEALEYSINNELLIISTIWSSGRKLKEGFNKIIERLGLENISCVGYAPRTKFEFPSDTYKALFWQECCLRGVLFGYANFINGEHSASNIYNTLDVVEEALEVVRDYYKDPLSRLCGTVPVSAITK